MDSREQAISHTYWLREVRERAREREKQKKQKKTNKIHYNHSNIAISRYVDQVQKTT